MDWVSPCLTSGLGNRLFQHAAAAGLAEQWKRPLIFLANRCTECPHGSIATLFRMFPRIALLQIEEPYTEITEVARGYYMYMPPPPSPPKGAVVINGFRQSPRYFPKDLSLLQPDWDSALGGSIIRGMIEREARLSTQEERRRTASIHVRLGDYLELPHHQVELTAYYAKALERISPGTRLYLFSDEPERCAVIFAGYCAQRGIEFTVAKTRSDVESLYEMSLCLGGNIVANSTFSWWGAWFAHQAGSPWATYPDNWGNGMPEPTDLFPEWATIIPV